MMSKKILSAFLVSVSLTACLETQTAPDIENIPSTEFKIDVIDQGLSNPWAVAELPNGDFLVTERGGKAYRLSSGDRTLLEGLPEDILAQGQGGLLDIVVAPDFASSSEIYLSYAYGSVEKNGTALLRAQLVGNTLENPVVIFKAGPPKSAPQHFGGRIVFLPDDTLVLTLGDGFAYREDAQKGDTHLGKIVRLTRGGDIPDDNPFVNQADYKPEIYSLGHRNVQGLAYDLETQTLWSHEHGPRGGDELNIIQSGQNYGWPIATKGTDYQGARISPFETYENMIDPIHDWTPSIAPSGLAIYRGDMFPEWNGDALIGGLASRDLRRVGLEKGQSVGEIDLLSDLEARIRDIRVASDGAILVLTDDAENGQLLRISNK